MNKSYPSQNMKRESLQGKKYLQLNKELVANIYKEFLQIKGQETDNPLGKKKSGDSQKWKNQKNKQCGKRCSELSCKGRCP